MVLAASSSMTAVAQHYVKIKNTTTSINGIQYEIGDIPNEEVDTVTALYIHILNLDGSQINTNRGIEKGAKFKVENFDNNIKKVKFYDKKGDKLRFDCFKEAEVLIKVKDDFIRYNDVTLLYANVNKYP